MGKRAKEPVAPTIIEDIVVFGLRARMAPVGLQHYAADFLSVAKAVPPPNVPFAPARPYLICHALELALKAFLSLRGRLSLEQLSDRKFGHNLQRLLAEAERHGLNELIDVTENQKSQIERASIYYSSKCFEYPAVGEALCAYPKMPDATVLEDTAEALITALREPCLHAD